MKDWPHVRAEMLALIENRAKRDPRFYRRYAELEVKEVDRALHRLLKTAQQMAKQ